MFCYRYRVLRIERADKIKRCWCTLGKGADVVESDNGVLPSTEKQ